MKLIIEKTSKCIPVYRWVKLWKPEGNIQNCLSLQRNTTVAEPLVPSHKHVKDQVLDTEIFSCNL